MRRSRAACRGAVPAAALAAAAACAESQVPRSSPVVSDRGGPTAAAPALLFAAAEDGMVSAVDPAAMRTLTAMPAGEIGLREVAVDAGRGVLYAGRPDQQAIVEIGWVGAGDAMEMAEAASFDVAAELRILAFAPGRRLLLGTSGNSPVALSPDAIPEGAAIIDRPSAVVLFDLGSGETVAVLGADQVRRPMHVAFTPDGEQAFVAAADAAAVVAYALPDMREIARIPVSTEEIRARVRAEVQDALGPIDIAMSEDGATLYTADVTFGTVTAIDVANLAPGRRYRFADGVYPHDVAPAPEGDLLWVVDIGIATAAGGVAPATPPETAVLAVEIAGGSVVERIPVAGALHVIAPGGGSAYVSTARGTVVVIDALARGQIGEIPTAAGSTGSAVHGLSY